MDALLPLLWGKYTLLVHERLTVFDVTVFAYLCAPTALVKLVHAQDNVLWHRTYHYFEVHLGIVLPE